MPQPLEIPFPAAVWVEHLEDDGARIPASKRPVQRGAPVLMERLDGRVFLVGRRAHRVAEGLSAKRALSIVNGRLRLRREPIEQRWHRPGRPAADLAAIRKAAGPPGGPDGWSTKRRLLPVLVDRSQYAHGDLQSWCGTGQGRGILRFASGGSRPCDG